MFELRNVCVSFCSEKQDKLFSKSRNQVLRNVSFHIKKGTCLGILGESGSGKSTLGRVLCGMLKPDSGSIRFNEREIYGSQGGIKELQKRISIVFQDYTTSANPRFHVQDIIYEGLAAQERKGSRKSDRHHACMELLELVGLDKTYMERYPHQLSGGQLQRVCIARAIACNPEIILFDEAISSLDAHTQVQVMDLLKDLKDRFHLTYVFITHDLTSVTYFCDEVIFLYKGKITEQKKVSDIATTKDPYAKKLLSSVIDFDMKRPLETNT